MAAAYDPSTFQPPDGEDRNSFFAKLNPGMPVAGQANTIWQHNPQSGWYWGDAPSITGGAAAGAGAAPASTGGALAPSPTTASAAAAPSATYNAATFQPPAGQDANSFFASLSPGMPVQGQANTFWQHNPQTGWYWSNSATGGGTGAAATPPAGTTTGGVQPAGAITPGGSISVAGAGGTAGLTTTPGGVTTGTAPTVPLGNTATRPLAAQTRAKIAELLATNVNAASISDPDLQPQADAFRVARERAQTQQNAAVMERLGAQGAGSSGAADLAQRQSAESAGQDVAGFNAGLVGQKLQQRQQMLTTALSAANALGMQEEAGNLQRQLAGLNAQIQVLSLGQNAQGQVLQTKLANMDASTKTYLANLDADLRREGYSTSERLAAMENELRKYGIDVQGNLGMLNAVIGLLNSEQQNTQFYDNLGFQSGALEATLNSGIINNLA